MNSAKDAQHTPISFEYELHHASVSTVLQGVIALYSMTSPTSEYMEIPKQIQDGGRPPF